MALRNTSRSPIAAGVLLAGFGATLVTATSARAEDTPPVKLDRVEVTGSNIRRADTETPSPVQVISAEDLKKSGYTSVSDVLRNITANNQGTLSQAFSQAFAAGGSGIALRGLSVGATLVLINGHRTAPYPLSDDGQRSFVDISAIPFDTVERIEVLKDGASAVYGSDAIAGVVNVILKKTFVGTRINAEAGTSYEHDGASQHLSITHGFGDLDSEGRNAYFSVEYRHQNPIRVIDRGSLFSNRDYRSVGGIDATPGVANANNGGLPGSLTGYTVNQTTGATTLLPGCSPSSPNYNYTGFCSYRNTAQQLQPDTHNLNLLGRFTQTLSADWTASLDASAFSSSSEQFVGYPGTNYAGGGIYGIAGGPGIIPAVYPASGPFLITAPNDPNQALIYNFPTLGVNHTLVDTQTYRLVGEINGTQGAWTLGASLGDTRAFTHSKNTGSLSIPGVQAVVAANPTANAAQLVAAFADPRNAGLLAPVASSTSSSEVAFLTVHGDREIGNLSGGPVGLGLGAELTYHKLNTLAPPAYAQGFQSGNDTFAIGTQTVTSAYVELVAPVLSTLEIDLAGRIDHYDTYGTSSTPKIGFKFSPMREVTLRGTYSQGFRAPNTAESGNAGQAFLYAATPDPLLCPGNGAAAGDFKTQCNINPTYFQKSNPALNPEKSTSYTFGAILEPSPGYSLTADYYSIRLANQISSAINVESLSALLGNAIRGQQGQLLQTVGNGTQATPYGTILYIPVPYVNANATETKGIELDLRGKWNLAEYGTLKADLDVTHVFKYTLISNGQSIELAGTHGPSGISGDTGTPKDRAQLTLTWERGPIEVSATANYISAFDVTDPASGLTTCDSALSSNFNGSFAAATPLSQISPGLCQVSSFTTVDLYARYVLDSAWTLHGSVSNAFNRSAPIDLETYGGSNYNPSLHQSGAIGRYFVVGATYAF